MAAMKVELCWLSGRQNRHAFEHTCSRQQCRQQLLAIVSNRQQSSAIVSNRQQSLLRKQSLTSSQSMHSRWPSGRQNRHAFEHT